MEGLRPLPYGLCVDALLCGYYWKGVLLDRCGGVGEGMIRRRVFFPDSCREHIINADRLRPTQVWDEGAGGWSLRGPWKFLLVLQELEMKGVFSPVSVAQLWHDLKSTPAFAVEIGEWSSGLLSAWRALTLEVIQQLVSVIKAPYTAPNPVQDDDGDGLAAEVVNGAVDGDGGRKGSSRLLSSCPNRISEISTKRMYFIDRLITLGWKIERINNRGGRCFYESPQGSVYTSLRASFLSLRNVSDGGPPIPGDHTGAEETEAQKPSTLQGDQTAAKETEAQKLATLYGDQIATEETEAQKPSTFSDTVLDLSIAAGISTDGCQKASFISLCNVSDGAPQFPEDQTAAEETEAQKPRTFSETVLDLSIAEGISTDGCQKASFISLRNASDDGPQIPGDQTAAEETEAQKPNTFSETVLDLSIAGGISTDGCQEENAEYGDGLCSSQRASSPLKLGPLSISMNPMNLKEYFRSVIKRQRVKEKLLALGWRIEIYTNPRSYLYLSPEGEVYKSLRGAYLSLCGISEGMALEQEDQTASQGRLKKKKKEADSDKGIPQEGTTLVLEDKPAAKGRIKKRKGEAGLGKKIVYDEGIESANLPEAIPKYMMFVESKRLHQPKEAKIYAGVLSSNARKHLLFLGWRLWIKTVGKRCLVYDSPCGKSYYSLYTACNASLNNFMGSHDKRKANHKRTEDESEDTLSHNSDSSHCGEWNSSKIHSNGKGRRMSKGLPPLENSVGSHEKRKANHKRTEDESGDILSHISDSSHCRGRNLSTIHSIGNRRRMSKGLPPTLLPIGKHDVRSVLSWMIGNDVILPREKFSYNGEGDDHILRKCRLPYGGRLTREGIKCNCCFKVFSFRKFMLHVGCDSRRPFSNIILQESGRSLLQCIMEKVQPKMTKGSSIVRVKCDDSHYREDLVCSICQDGGLLLVCECCPSCFHQECVGLKDFPEGKWYCPSCQCRICGLSEFNSNIGLFTEKTILYCDQCEQQHHVGCCRQKGLHQLTDPPTESWFCTNKCSMIFNHLYQLLGRSNQTARKDLSWTLLKPNNFDDDNETMVDCYVKLRVALDILHECFAKIFEPRTQSDLVEDLLFNKVSELRRLDFRGFYTMLLMRDDEVISVALFRIFGEKVAEMPFICTRLQYRRQGMCRILVNELEKLLSTLGVKMFVLPAVPLLLETWKTSFGFHEMSSTDKRDLVRYGMLNFLDTTWCQKILCPEYHKQLLNNSNSYTFEAQTPVKPQEELSLPPTSSPSLDDQEGTMKKADAFTSQDPSLFHRDSDTMVRPTESSCKLQNNCMLVETSPPTFTFYYNKRRKFAYTKAPPLSSS